MLKLSIKNISGYRDYEMEIKDIRKLNFIEINAFDPPFWPVIISLIKNIHSGMQIVTSSADSGDLSITIDWEGHTWLYLLSVDRSGKVIFEEIFIDGELAIYYDLVNNNPGVGNSIAILCDFENRNVEEFWNNLSCHYMMLGQCGLFIRSFNTLKRLMDYIQVFDGDLTESIHINHRSYSIKVIKAYRKLMPRLGLGIYEVSSTLRYKISPDKDIYMDLDNMGSGVRVLSIILPIIIRSIIDNKICIIKNDLFQSLHPVLKQYLLGIYKKFHRSKLILFTYDVEAYYIDQSYVLKTQLSEPRNLIYE